MSWLGIIQNQFHVVMNHLQKNYTVRLCFLYLFISFFYFLFVFCFPNQLLRNVFTFRDLAVDLRMKLGDWFRVVQLVKWGGGGGK